MYKPIVQYPSVDSSIRTHHHSLPRHESNIIGECEQIGWYHRAIRANRIRVHNLLDLDSWLLRLRVACSIFRQSIAFGNRIRESWVVEVLRHKILIDLLLFAWLVRHWVCSSRICRSLNIRVNVSVLFPSSTIVCQLLYTSKPTVMEYSRASTSGLDNPPSTEPNCKIWVRIQWYRYACSL